MTIRILVLLLMMMPGFAAAAEYVVVYEASRVGFSSTHAGKDFSGDFGSWQAEINFDAEDLAGSSVRVVFDSATALTGDKLYDKTLPHHDWLAVEAHPQIVFQSTAISAAEDGYQMVGDLTIKGDTQPVTFNFTLNVLEDGRTNAVAEFMINRLERGIGVEADPKAAWVSEEIAVSLDIVARVKE